MKNAGPGEKYAELRYQQLVRTATSGFILTENERQEFFALKTSREKKKSSDYDKEAP